MPRVTVDAFNSYEKRLEITDQAMIRLYVKRPHFPPQVYVLSVEAAADLQRSKKYEIESLGQTGGLSAGKRYRDK